MAKEENIKVVVIEPGALPYSKTIPNTLEAFQKEVDGRIESVSFLFDDSPAVYVNEEGKFNGCLPNRAVYATKENVEEGYMSLFTHEALKEGELVDIMFGTILCCGFDEEEGVSKSISSEEIERVMSRFGKDSIGSGMKEVRRILGERL